MLVRSWFCFGVVLALSGCAGATLAGLPAEEQQLWSRCEAAMRASCEHEVREQHFATVDECLRADEREYAARATGERRSYLQHHGCSASAMAGSGTSGGAAP